MTPTISIIVPVYNVEMYLRRSIDSLINQTYKSIEIILVNDGSTDCSLDICKEYENSDTRIVVLDKANGGVSSARNAGLRIATGEYIGFSDPDDWIEPDMYENMIKKIIETNSELCISNYIREKNGISTPKKLGIEKSVLHKNDITNIIVANMITASIMGSVCRLLIKKSVIDKHNLLFNHTVSYMEDLIFCIQLFLRIDTVCIDNSFSYHYMSNMDSATKTYRSTMYQAVKEVYELILHELVTFDVYPQLESPMNVHYLKIYTHSIQNEASSDNTKSLIDKVTFIKELCNDEKLQNIVHAIDFKGYSLKKKIVLRAIGSKKALFLYMYHYLYSLITQKIKAIGCYVRRSKVRRM